MLARKLPVEHTVVGIDLTTIEQRQDVDAVNMLRQVLRCSCEGCKSGHDVGEIDGVLKTLHRNLARLIDDERHTYASLIELTFAPLEAGIAVQLFYGSLYGSAIV